MKIAFICPYFGELPNYFELLLKSCKHNSTIDWIIFTDNKINYEIPSNVKVINVNFNDFVK